MLTPDQTKYFDDLESMFGTAGWRIIVDEARKQIYQFQADALEAKSYEAICFLRGQAEQLARLVNLQDVTITLRAQHAVEDDEDGEVA